MRKTAPKNSIQKNQSPADHPDSFRQHYRRRFKFWMSPRGLALALFLMLFGYFLGMYLET